MSSGRGFNAKELLLKLRNEGITSTNNRNNSESGNKLLHVSDVSTGSLTTTSKEENILLEQSQKLHNSKSQQSSSHVINPKDTLNIQNVEFLPNYLHPLDVTQNLDMMTSEMHNLKENISYSKSSNNSYSSINGLENKMKPTNLDDNKSNLALSDLSISRLPVNEVSN
jgi:hypothetical protein